MRMMVSFQRFFGRPGGLCRPVPTPSPRASRRPMRAGRGGGFARRAADPPMPFGGGMPVARGM